MVAPDCRIEELEAANETLQKDIRVTRVKELEVELKTYYDMARQCVKERCKTYLDTREWAVQHWRVVKRDNDVKHCRPNR